MTAPPVRYVRRKDQHAYDLTHAEAAGLLDAGIGLMIVQHVAPEGWTPTIKDGASYGSTAAAESTTFETSVSKAIVTSCRSAIRAIAASLP